MSTTKLEMKIDELEEKLESKDIVIRILSRKILNLQQEVLHKDIELIEYRKL